MKRDVDLLLKANSNGNSKWEIDKDDRRRDADTYGKAHWNREDGAFAITSDDGYSLFVHDGGKAMRADTNKQEKGAKPPSGF